MLSAAAMVRYKRSITGASRISPSITTKAWSWASNLAIRSRARAASSTVGLKVSLMKSICFGWIAVLPVNPIFLGLGGLGAQSGFVVQAEIRHVQQIDAGPRPLRALAGHAHKGERPSQGLP